ncbi:MAG TPA: AAA family ATPase [Allosphingosinicella sp.]|jgi:exopolysaccharide/PEP-CTERM locus tyrosine autokinase
MNKHSPLSHSGSLLERAAELYGFGSPARMPEAPVAPAPEPEIAREAEVAHAADPAPRPFDSARGVAQDKLRPGPGAAEDLAPGLRRGAGEEAGRTFLPVVTEAKAEVDRKSLGTRGFIVPDSPAGPLAEEFRIVKRQLLLGMGAGSPISADKRRTILVCSAQPDEGKTFCAVNLALSLAGERDMEVLLVDADFPKPEVLSILGLEAREAGFVDALADPSLDPEQLVIRTDIGNLSVMPAGRYENDVPELLGSARTAQVLARLTEGRPKRIVIFDSPPALMASAAAALAAHVGQLLLVVRADQTNEADLKEAAGLLSGCPQISLLLNGTGFAATGRKFGSYYGYGQ